ncbi:DUF4328 domain-containing protein [Streptomyces sp. NPDC000151]|uniref:DUF4328 domain-containing protein n=1 Tax=Streptomyces sp. NPDC000151 TaxID=3154244 RepID=UPI00332C3042
MLCSNCHMVTAVTADGRCEECAATEREPGGTSGAPAPPRPAARTARTGRLGALASPLRSAAVVTVLLALCIAADAFALAAGGRYVVVLNDLVSQRWVSPGLPAELAAADRAYTFSGSLYIALLPMTAVAFLVWFFRTRINAEVFAPDGHRRGRLWTLGAWFTPLVNLWFPRQIAGDIWKASTPPDRRAPLTLLNAWWCLWVASKTLAFVGNSQLDKAEEYQALRTALRTVFVSDLLDATAAALAITVVCRLTALQIARMRGVGLLPATPPPPAVQHRVDG